MHIASALKKKKMHALSSDSRNVMETWRLARKDIEKKKRKESGA